MTERTGRVRNRTADGDTISDKFVSETPVREHASADVAPELFAVGDRGGQSKPADRRSTDTG